ncbi:MBG domain-containing protein [Lysobacter sp. CA199]|uniref:MBG domain-containing protein n=1 Tax=Lysobacter sp. CA199 TaxID=3455608 RepID=UPI003F8D6031
MRSQAVGADALAGSVTRATGETVGAYAIGQGSLNNANYAISFVDGQLQITPRAISITADTLSKIYGNLDPTLSYRVTGGNLVGSDTLNGGLDRAAGENVGNYAVGQGSLSNGNYAISFVDGQLQILPRGNAVSADLLGKVYGNADPILTWRITQGELVGGDTLQGALSRQSGENVGNYAIGQGSLANGNYAIGFVDGQLQIAPRPVTVTANNLAKIYGDLDPSLTWAITAGNLVGSDSLSGGLSRSGGENVGRYLIGQGSLANGNYTISFVDGGLSISPRPISIAANGLRKVYGDADPFLSWSVTGGLLIGNDTLNGSLTRQAGENAGGFAIGQGSLGNGNYTIDFAGAQLQITPASLTVRADDLTGYWGLLPAYSSSIVGLRRGDRAADVLSGSPSYSTDANGPFPGEYRITPSGYGLLSGNYTLNYENGLLRLLPSEPRVAGQPEGAYRAAFASLDLPSLNTQGKGRKGEDDGAAGTCHSAEDEGCASADGQSVDRASVRVIDGGMRLPVGLSSD